MKKVINQINSKNRRNLANKENIDKKDEKIESNKQIQADMVPDHNILRTEIRIHEEQNDLF